MIVTSYNLRATTLDRRRFHMTLDMEIMTFEEAQQIERMIHDRGGRDVTMSFEEKKKG